MKKLIRSVTLLVGALCFLCSGFSWAADPVFHLRRQYGDSQDGYLDIADFTKNGTHYEAIVKGSDLEGSGWFKITTDGWKFNFGPRYEDKSYPQSSTDNVETMFNQNYNFTYKNDFGNLKISFDLNMADFPNWENAEGNYKGNNGPTVHFEPYNGDIEDVWSDNLNWPTFVIRRNSNNGNSYSQVDTPFVRTLGTNEYVAIVEGSKLSGDGNWFKICADNDKWEPGYGVPGDKHSDQLPLDIQTEYLGSDNNFHYSDSWGNIKISFNYNYYKPEDCPVVHIERYEGDIPTPGISQTLPVLYINVYTDGSKTQFNNTILSYDPIDDIMSKDYERFPNAYYWLDTQYIDKNDDFWKDKDGKTIEDIGGPNDELVLQIKGRGNWTLRGFAKKPFKLKLDKKQNLLGLTPDKSKHYALLAHADDMHGYLKNFVGFNLGKRIGLPWTPDQRPVEVVINGNYRGLYFLTESIRIDDGRIEITEVKDKETDMCQVTGGYVVEFDNYRDDAVIIIDSGQAINDDPHRFPIYVTPDTPEKYSDQQLEFVNSQIWAMHNALGDHSDRAWSYLDLDDAVRYYLVEEIIGHYEAYHGSTYLYREQGAGEKWHFSPLWDCGHAFEGGTNNFFYASNRSYGNTWIRSMKENDKFNQRLNETWKWFMSQKYDGLFNDIDKYASVIAEAAKCDRQRWAGIRSNYTGTDEAAAPVEDNSNMSAKVEEVKAYLNAKIDWLKKYQWGDYANYTDGEPKRDNTEPAELDEEYINTLPHKFNWEGSFEKKPSMEFDGNGRRHKIGSLAEKASSNNIEEIFHVYEKDLSLTVDEEWAQSNWSDGYNEYGVTIGQNGDVYLNAKVPGKYTVNYTMDHHLDADKHYPGDTFKQTVTLLPSFADLKISAPSGQVNYNQQTKTITYVGVSAQDAAHIKFGLPFPGKLWYKRTPLQWDGVDLPLLPQDEQRNDAPRKAATEWEGYSTDGEINMVNVASITLSHEVNGVPSAEETITAAENVPTGIANLLGDDESQARYFDLSGVEVSLPTKPGIYVRVNNGNAVKVVVK